MRGPAHDATTETAAQRRPLVSLPSCTCMYLQMQMQMQMQRRIRINSDHFNLFHVFSIFSCFFPNHRSSSPGRRLTMKPNPNHKSLTWHVLEDSLSVPGSRQERYPRLTPGVQYLLIFVLSLASKTPWECLSISVISTGTLSS